MGARMVAFLESLSGLDCLDCLAEKGKPESKRHKLETGWRSQVNICRALISARISHALAQSSSSRCNGAPQNQTWTPLSRRSVLTAPSLESAIY